LNKDGVCAECSLRKAGLKTWNEWYIETARRWKAEKKAKAPTTQHENEKNKPTR